MFHLARSNTSSIKPGVIKFICDRGLVCNGLGLGLGARFRRINVQDRPIWRDQNIEGLYNPVSTPVHNSRERRSN